MEPRHGVLPKGGGESSPDSAADGDPRPPEKRQPWCDLTVSELRRLAEEGKTSGLSEEDGEALLDRLEARYRDLIARKSGA